VVLVGRLVDITATLTELSFEPTESDEKQLRALGATIAIIRTDLMNRRLSSSIHFDSDHVFSHVPLLTEMQNIVSFIPQAFTDSESMKVRTCRLHATCRDRNLCIRTHSLIPNTLSSH
jgi:hypothetical protein